MEQGGANREVAGSDGGGEQGFAFAQGDEQQVGVAGFVPEHAFAMDPGGGWPRLNRMFGGELEQVLLRFQEAVWEAAA